MSSRWKMNRMGFVNFWLYDEETFEFENGKLLLRGQNGSGKSITTQSFIPFILDGDRTPSRLDPFGSSDRKMEYYFLGEEGREEATGYLFLEFRKEDSGKYRTVCIGQRARRGAPMTFWGFVLTDGRRIGFDLSLYKETGGAKLPYSKQDIKRILGPEVPFADTPGEYKALVNQYIFGFRRMEQYEQFIRLLVKVRAPKLSKEFKPTKVYDILNESLQTLTDEELRAMVDAMEKMDAIQNSLEHLKAAQKDAQIIHTEYVRYNQYMLGRKARAYLDAGRRVRQLKEQTETEEEKQRLWEREEFEKREAFQKAEQDERLVSAELAGLKETDLDKVTEQLSADEKQQAEFRTEITEWEEKAEEAREHLLETDRRIREYEGEIEDCRMRAGRTEKDMEEFQEILCFDLHEEVRQKIRRERADGVEGITKALGERQEKIDAGLRVLKEQEELDRQYDQAAEISAGRLAAAVKREAEQEALAEQEEQAREAWIGEIYALAGKNQELVLDRALLDEFEADILAYQGPKDAGAIRTRWEQCAGKKQNELWAAKKRLEQEREKIFRERQQKQEEWEALQKKKDWEPERSPERIHSRELLAQAGVSWVPFYQAVEFAPGLSDRERNLLEGQLKEAGVLDALVVERRDWERIRTEFPEYADQMICVPAREEGALFAGLIPEETLSDGLKKETEYILRAISEEGKELTLETDGSFRNGILRGRSLGREEASFIGLAARKRRWERQAAILAEELALLARREEQSRSEEEVLARRKTVLEEELARTPDGTVLDRILDEKRICLWYLERERQELEEARKEEERLKREREACLQKVIRAGKELPYARTSAAYQEARDAAEEYRDLWRDAVSLLQKLIDKKSLAASEREKGEQYEDAKDLAIRQVLDRKKKCEVLAVKIRRAQEFLDRPENRELAGRLQRLRSEEERLRKFLQEVKTCLAVLQNQREQGAERLEEKRAALTEEIAAETMLWGYFEEELALGLVMGRGTKTGRVCAEEAWNYLRESDRGREPGAMTDSLYQVYHKYSGTLVSYGVAMEECFPEGASDGNSLRTRQRIFSVWNGRKLYFAQFCQTLKSSVEETELLIQEKDRELFVDILSRTLSQQLTERIEESRQWIRDMSALMKQMDTSMGLSFSLEWKPKSAESEQEIDTLELEKLLRRDQRLLTSEDVERVAGHFRSKIRLEKRKREEEGIIVNYMDLVRDALDYRKWFEFKMFYYRNQEGKKPLTNAAFNKFSGGEKAMAMYVPLFAAVNAQYQKSSREDFPRIIALDEAFAGVDDKNISSMFQLVETLDLDYIMNSQAIWGCYETVPALRISELYRPADAQTVTVIHYTWNGHERILDEQ